METSFFSDGYVDAYEQDILWLWEARGALLSHPMRSEGDRLSDAPFTRMLVVTMVGNVEAWLRAWAKREPDLGLETYFARSVKNRKKVEVVRAALEKRGIALDEDVTGMYLAVKYLRNIIVHSVHEPREDDIQWITDHGFPADPRLLRADHWWTIFDLNNLIVRVIWLAGSFGDHRGEVGGPWSLPDGTHYERLGLVCKENLPRIFWRNLEKISMRLDRVIEGTVSSGDWHWARGRPETDANEMEWQEVQRLKLLTARSAAHDGSTLLNEHQHLGEAALESWREYWRLTSEVHHLTVSDTESAQAVLTKLGELGVYPKGGFLPWTEEVEAELGLDAIRLALEGYAPLAEAQIAEALTTGRNVYNLGANPTAAMLLATQLPAVDPERTVTYLEEAETALLAYELARAWYSYVEHGSFEIPSLAPFYRRMLNEFRALAQDGG